MTVRSGSFSLRRIRRCILQIFDKKFFALGTSGGSSRDEIDVRMTELIKQRDEYTFALIVADRLNGFGVDNGYAQTICENMRQMR